MNYGLTAKLCSNSFSIRPTHLVPSLSTRCFKHLRECAIRSVQRTASRKNPAIESNFPNPKLADIGFMSKPETHSRKGSVQTAKPGYSVRIQGRSPIFIPIGFPVATDSPDLSLYFLIKNYFYIPSSYKIKLISIEASCFVFESSRPLDDFVTIFTR
ncbi:hypothetical protein [Methylosarcina fibrata]|uniref:hypothetical protein n=1 Tax=Methylosarcina fibrata TaxID=105972 RepID=UPI0018DEE189|nr:hypothetical protein [Methylosarcina fibrata]